MKQKGQGRYDLFCGIGGIRFLPGEGALAPHVTPESLGGIIFGWMVAAVFAGKAEVEGHQGEEKQADGNGKIGSRACLGANE